MIVDKYVYYKLYAAYLRVDEVQITTNDSILDDNLGFWHDKCIVILSCPDMIISSFSNMKSYVFQVTNELRMI